MPAVKMFTMVNISLGGHFDEARELVARIVSQKK